MNQAISLRSARLVLGAVLGVGAFFRVISLGRQSLIFDELYVLMIDKYPLRQMIRESFAASHLPLYHLVVRVWLLAGHSQTWVRLLSVVAGLAVIFLTYLVARELFSMRVALWSAALVAVSPFLIWYSSAATFYSFMIALTMLSFYMLVRSMTRSGWMNWAGYLAATMAVYLTYFYAAILVVAAFFVYWLLGSRKGRELWIFLSCQAMLLAVALPVFAVSRLAVTEPTKRLTFGPGEIKTVLIGIAVSPYALIGGWLEPMVSYSGREGLPVFHLLITGLVLLTGLALFLTKGFRRRFDRKLVAVGVFTLFLIAGPLALQVANQARMSGRLYIWALPFLIIFAAALLTGAPGRLRAVMAAASLAGLLCLSVWQLASPPVRDADWQQLMSKVGTQWQEGDRLACFPLHNCTLAADYYLPDLTGIVGGMPLNNGQGVFFMPPGARWTGYGSGYWAEYGTTPPLTGTELNRRLGNDLAGARRVWLIGQSGLLDQQPDIDRTLEAGWRPAEKTNYGHFDLILYDERSGSPAG